MLRKLLVLITVAVIYATTGCVRETYDMDTLSKQAHISPTFAVSVFRGDISLKDLIKKTNDTVFFDENDLLKFVFREDSIIYLTLDDYQDFDNLVEFHIDEGYQLSPLSFTEIKDTITFDPGNDIKIERLVITTGSIDYVLRSKSLTPASYLITLPTVLRGGTPVSKTIIVSANQTVSGSLSLNSTDVDFSSDPNMQYNRIPVNYSVTATAGSFNLYDSMFLKLDMDMPDFDYAKGYFGNKSESFEADTLDLDIREILDHITGEFLISNPSIKLNYWNSFALPVKIDLQATGYKMEDEVELGYNPFPLAYPDAPSNRDIAGTLTIDKNNSSLPQLISMPPEKIRFSGSTVMNADDQNTMDNYIFGDSRFLGNLEIEVPMELRISNLQFMDTTDNFLQMDDTEDSPIKPEDFEFLRIRIEAENGFPLGISLSLILHDSTSGADLCTIEANDILTPAPVNSEGRVTTAAVGTTNIDITRDFWESINVADKIIFKFSLNTTDDGSKDVKFYSDYKINFKAALVLKPDIKFDMK